MFADVEPNYFEVARFVQALKEKSTELAAVNPDLAFAVEVKENRSHFWLDCENGPDELIVHDGSAVLSKRHTDTPSTRVYYGVRHRPSYTFIVKYDGTKLVLKYVYFYRWDRLRVDRFLADIGRYIDTTFLVKCLR